MLCVYFLVNSGRVKCLSEQERWQNRKSATKTGTSLYGFRATKKVAVI